MSDPDRRLVERAQRGDAQALTGLYETHKRPLLGFLSRMLRRPEAEEVLQEVWIKVMESIVRYRPGQATFRTWLFRVAHNAALDRMRREKLRAGPSLDTAPDDDSPAPIANLKTTAPGPEREAVGLAFSDDLVVALEELPPRQRAAVLLRHQQGLRYHEIAEAMGIAEGTAKTSVHRGVLQLRKRLRGWSHD